MKIAFAADHAGYPLKQILVEAVSGQSHEAIDLGTHDPAQPTDYPDYAERACEAVRRGDVERAIIVCGSGVGASVVANKFPGIRAGLCHDTYSAHQGVEHDDMNVLCVGARIVGSELAREIVGKFLGAEFSHVERHCRRVAKVGKIEQRFLK